MKKINNSYVDEEGKEPVLLDPFDPKKVSIATRPLTWTNIITRMRKKTITLAPPYQRKEVWDINRKSQLIESLLLNIPIPMFYVAADELGNFEVVDGLQRLSALRDFVFPNGDTDSPPTGEGFLLQGLEFLDLNEKSFAELDDFYVQRLEETQFTFIVIGPGTPEEVKFHIFSIINRGGLSLSDQEVRHALYNGPASFLLQELTETSIFQNIAGKAFKKEIMEDREVVLRMLSFMIRSEKAFPGKGTRMGDFLSETMLIINAMPDFTLPRFLKKFTQEDLNGIKFNSIEKIKEHFVLGLNRAKKLFGEHTFRKSLPPNKRNRINKALLDTWGSLLACMEDNTFNDLYSNKENMFKKYIEIMNNDNFSRAISSNALEKDSIELRFKTIRDLCLNRNYN